MRALSRSSSSAGSGVLPNHRSNCPVTVVRVFDNPSLSFCNHPILCPRVCPPHECTATDAPLSVNFPLEGVVDPLNDAKSAHGVASDERPVCPAHDRSRINAECHESAIPQVLHQRN